MKRITFIRLFILLLVTACSLSLLVVGTNSSVQKSDDEDRGQHGLKYIQGEFIIWETMGQVILSTSK